MHSTSTPSLADESIRHELSSDSSAKRTGARKKFDGFSVAALRRPVGIPRELDKYLTTTNELHEIFVSLQDSRDRRLRLLLRRFYNQIQYGCKNPYCHIQTCLSYRKRVAIAPVRPYTDIVARALAWRCVEQYTDADKGQNQSGISISVSKGKEKHREHPYSNVSGLCWSDPVVPWYDDPSEAGRKSKTLRHQRKLRELNTQQGHLCASSKCPSAADDEAEVIDQKQAPEQNILIAEAQHRQDEGLIDSKDTSVLPKDISGSDGHNGCGSSQRKFSRSEPRQVTFAEPLEEHILYRQTVIKDQASFTQMIYDTSNVKDLGPIKNGNKLFADTASPPVDSGQRESRHVSDLDRMSHADSMKSTPGVWTFGVLPLSVVFWLRCTMPYDSQSSPLRDLNVTEDYGDYSTFARQSLYLCLSNPLKLLRSAATWRFVHGQPYKLDQHKRVQIIKELASIEAVKLDAPMARLPQPGGIMVALGMLIAISSIPEVLDHLFAALQHAYILPPWLERVRYRENSSLRNRPMAKDAGSETRTKAFCTRNLFPFPDVYSTNSNPPAFLEDEVVAQMCMLAVLALQLILALKTQPFTLMHAIPLKDFAEQYFRGRKSGVVFPYASLFKAWSGDENAGPKFQGYTSRLDAMDGWSFQRILDCFADIISHRLAIAGTSKTNKSNANLKTSGNVIDLFINEILQASEKPDSIIHRYALQKNLIDLLRSVILRRWDREAVIQKRGPVGGALELLAALFRKKNELGIPTNEFQWAFIGDTFDEIDMPVKWLEFREDNTQTHILAYAFLFEPVNLVTYFRAINSVMMKRSGQYASSIFTDAFKFLRHDYYNVYGVDEVLAEMRPNMARFFVLTIRRSHMLQDAINQIWRRQRQELLRPLKVRLGREEGEDGLDHGGVQAEFFRMVFAEALDPNYGMFTIDERTRMTWFQPGSVEPLYKFEVLGILMSLAVYNGITLPITFPLAFYRKILGLKVKTIMHIKDGWPDLARGLQQLLDWDDGDVGEVISRTYEFSYEAFGASYTVDMTKIGRDDPWPTVDRSKSREKLKTASFDFPPDFSPISPVDADMVNGHLNSSDHTSSPSPTSVNGTVIPVDHSTSTPSSSSSELEPELATTEAPLVTNANRNAYVKDYIYWLTHKSISLQFTAFATGFLTCLDRTALSIFTPEHLRTVIEGHQHIDIDGLQATTTYDDYKPTDDVVSWFWQVVRDMSTTQHRHLLEFVTASDRVPVNGISSIVFIVQKNGEDDERLPSSSTCYGRLLMPKYSSKAVLKEKLEKAIENSVGFGSL